MDFKNSLAHIDQKDTSKNQLLINHLINTGNNCYRLGEEITIGHICMLAGLLHDVGKVSDAFQFKIKRNSSSFVDHSTMGGKIIRILFLDTYSNKDLGDFEKTYDLRNSNFHKFSDYCHILIYAILSHHGQYDFIKKNEDNNYDFTTFKRLSKKILDDESDYLEVYNDLSSELFKYNIHLLNVFKFGFKEYLNLCEKLQELTKKTSDIKQVEAKKFYQSLLIRLVVSILKASDIKDSINAYGEIVKDEFKLVRDEKLDLFEGRINDKYKSFKDVTRPINQIRLNIAKEILDRSKKDASGIYKLDLPTGAGKTLLSLRYGINQMKYQKKDRFFYVTSFLSVLEQNASEIKNILREEEYILEHHSNVVDEDKKDFESDSFYDIRRQFIANDWTSPVVLTTMVQFFNSIYKGKSSNLTRFKSFINSVIILDELQSLPADVLYSTNLALNFLNKIMNATIILSTATQPTYSDKNLNYKMIYCDNLNRELIQLKNNEKEVFKRVKCVLFDGGKVSSLQDISALVENNIDKSILIILNTKSVVKDLYTMLKDYSGENSLYYLTTNLHANDRLEKILEIKQRLKRDEKIIVVSTALVEAGVDLDFEVVIRSLTGLDSIVQAMGRCNREGKLAQGICYIVNIDENIEKIGNGFRKEQKDASEYVLRKNDIVDVSELSQKYFTKLYSNVDDRLLNYKIQDTSLIDLLSINKNYTDSLLKQRSNNLSYIIFPKFNNLIFSKDMNSSINLFANFKTAYDNFNLISDNNINVVIECEENEKLINELRNLEKKFSGNYEISIIAEIRNIIRKLNRFTVPIKREELYFCQNIMEGMVYILPSNFYDSEIGIKLEEPDNFIL